MLVSVYAPEAILYSENYGRKAIRSGRYSYLLMRRLPRGSTHARTDIISEDWQTRAQVLGCCDLDGDGWAEIITRSDFPDWLSTYLYDRAGRRFRCLLGSGWGI